LFTRVNETIRTQHIVNQGIDNLFIGLGFDEEGNPVPQPPVPVELDENNFIEDAIFGPPQVIVTSDYSNLKSVDLRLHLKAGTLQLRNYKGKVNGKAQAEKLRLVINDWFVTVPVDVGMSLQSFHLDAVLIVNHRLRESGAKHFEISSHFRAKCC
jgi:hypothetical protein